MLSSPSAKPAARNEMPTTTVVANLNAPKRFALAASLLHTRALLSLATPCHGRGAAMLR